MPSKHDSELCLNSAEPMVYWTLVVPRVLDPDHWVSAMEHHGVFPMDHQITSIALGLDVIFFQQHSDEQDLENVLIQLCNTLGVDCLFCESWDERWEGKAFDMAAKTKGIVDCLEEGMRMAECIMENSDEADDEKLQNTVRSALCADLGEHIEPFVEFIFQNAKHIQSEGPFRRGLEL